MRPIPNLRWWFAGLLAVAMALNYLDRQSFPVVVKIVQRDIPISDRQFSELQASFLLAYSLMYAGGGRIIDSLGTRVGYVAVILWWSAANILHGFATSVLGLGIFRFLLGLGEGGGFPGAAKAASEWFPTNERATAFGIFNAGSSLGAVVAPPLIALLIAAFGNWRFVFFTTGMCGVVWAVVWWRVYEIPARHRRVTQTELSLLADVVAAPTAPPRYREFFRFSAVWGLLAAKFLTDSAWFFLIFWLPKYLADVRGLNIQQIGWYAWIPYACAAVGGLSGGALSSLLLRRGFSLNIARKAPLALSAALMPVVLLIASVPLGFAIVLFGIALFGHQFWSTVIQTLSADFFAPNSVGSIAGLMGAVGSFGAMLFNLLAGAMLGSSHHYNAIFAILGVLHPASFLILWFSARQIGRLPVLASS